MTKTVMHHLLGIEHRYRGSSRCRLCGRAMQRISPQIGMKNRGSTRQERGKQYSCSAVLRPVILTLRIVGVCVLPSLGCRIWAMSVTLFRLLYLGSCISNMVLNNSFAFEYISVVLTTVSSLLASSLLNFSSAELRKAVDKLDYTIKQLPAGKGSLKSCFRRIVGLTLIGWLYLVLRLIAAICVVDNAPAQQQFQSIFYRKPPDHFSDIASYVCVALVASLEVFFIQGALIFTPVLFMSVCMILAEAYAEHNRVIVNLVGPTEDLGVEFNRVRSFHEKLCSLVTYMDSIFGKVIFFWFLFLVVTVCMDITQLFTDDTLLKNKTQDDVFFFSLKVIYSVLSFLGTCATAANVSQKAHDSLPTVHALTLRTNRMDLDTKLQVQFFLNRLTSPTVGLSGWNFFTINKGFILNVSAALVTYTVVVIQMNPKAMRVIHHLVAQTVNNGTNNNGNSDSTETNGNSTNSSSY
ncbi:uncharacterized protein TNCT_284011 [Trichonephila clavata]|uniref:Gustatory receptor n=1 Tax=Trichonephila clavata TaxID=2740835 RepID=A0A8X6FWU4_TRICU|nr:uncharacterized protein TNCT_284011 [Trichonephila clavata]